MTFINGGIDCIFIGLWTVSVVGYNYHVAHLSGVVYRRLFLISHLRMNKNNKY